MTGLADTISRLSRMRRLSPENGSDRLSDMVDFGSNPGRLRARLYIPQGLGADAPLVTVLHGCTQNAAGYDHGAGWSILADLFGFALLFPEQSRANNPNLCFNWFDLQHIQRDRGEALSIRQMVEAVQSRYGLDRARTFVTGLSAGGAMTSVMLATYPDVFAGGAIIAGLPYGVASSVPEAFGAMRGSARLEPRELAAKVRSASNHDGPWPLISVWHGSGDQTVAASNGRATVEQWREVHGLSAKPSEVGSESAASRLVWRDATGRIVLEELVVPGMGHGTPVDPTLTGGGASGAYMLDVGISSSHKICRFWGIAANDLRPAKVEVEKGSAIPAAPAPRLKQKARLHLASEEAAKEPATETGVAKVINDALRAAGLMR